LPTPCSFAIVAANAARSSLSSTRDPVATSGPSRLFSAQRTLRRFAPTGLVGPDSPTPMSATERTPRSTGRTHALAPAKTRTGRRSARFYTISTQRVENLKTLGEGSPTSVLCEIHASTLSGGSDFWALRTPSLPHYC
jgi:hypothetical protein